MGNYIKAGKHLQVERTFQKEDHIMAFLSYPLTLRSLIKVLENQKSRRALNRFVTIVTTIAVRLTFKPGSLNL